MTLLSQDGGSMVTLRVEGELDNLIKALGNYPVSDMNFERQSLEEAFLAYYESTEKEEI